VLVPAHNEQLVIADTLASIASQLDTGDRLVVVADNCADQTADTARQQGAEVTVRTDTTLYGKGFALDHGVRFLEQTGRPDVVIFVDADCKLNETCIERLGRLCVESKQPIQAAYLMLPPRQPHKMGALVSFAWKVKDFVRPLGWHRLNLPCQLAGSGMAFPWELIRSANIAGGHLVEDLKLGLDLALAGRFPQFCPDAVVASDVATAGTPSYSQRARWEHGTIETMGRYLPRLLLASWKNRSLPLLAMALDLSVPPLALLTLALGAQSTLALLFLLITATTTPAIIGGVTCALFMVSIILAWWRHGREILPFRWLVFAPLYAIGKIPLYVRFFVNRQKEWISGERELHS
jgi:cellulose synthase/poly-beta-1,6-N-acetylglucosamine synthase-like glycosyltransferase